MTLKLPERRRFIRIEVPLKVKFEANGVQHEIMTKNISPIGMRFEVPDPIEESSRLDLEVYLPSTDGYISIAGKVIWQRRTSLEDNAPYDVGMEIIEIEEESKNVLLKYLCDLLYDSDYRSR